LLNEEEFKEVVNIYSCKYIKCDNIKISLVLVKTEIVFYPKQSKKISFSRAGISSTFPSTLHDGLSDANSPHQIEVCVCPETNTG